jgi:hypothetical protein
MQNDQGHNVDLYIPRKCSWTNRLLQAQDKASVQVRVSPATLAVHRHLSIRIFSRECASFAM